MYAETLLTDDSAEGFPAPRFPSSPGLPISRSTGREKRGSEKKERVAYRLIAARSIAQAQIVILSNDSLEYVHKSSPSLRKPRYLSKLRPLTEARAPRLCPNMGLGKSIRTRMSLR